MAAEKGHSREGTWGVGAWSHQCSQASAITLRATPVDHAGHSSWQTAYSPPPAFCHSFLRLTADLGMTAAWEGRARSSFPGRPSGGSRKDALQSVYSAASPLAMVPGFLAAADNHAGTHGEQQHPGQVDDDTAPLTVFAFPRGLCAAVPPGVPGDDWVSRGSARDLSCPLGLTSGVCSPDTCWGLQTQWGLRWAAASPRLAALSRPSERYMLPSLGS